jgi:acyl-CoA synthetase (AMP-forming)/AMP-acid ligase II
VASYREWSLAGWREHLPERADANSLAAALAGESIPALAAASAAAAPGRVAVTVDGEPVTHAELGSSAERVAGWLARRVQPGDRVLLAAGASIGFVRCYLGALKAGAVVVLANPQYQAAELGHLVTDSGAVLALADPGPGRLLAARGLPVVDVADLPSGGRGASEVAVGPQDVALLAYTSGTTGKPKGVPLTHGQLAVSIRSAMAAWRWSADDVLAHALPLYHQHGLSGLHAALIAGATVHIRSRFSPADLVRTIDECDATVLFAVPTIYQALMSADAATAPLASLAPLFSPAPLRRLRLAVCGSAPLNPALAERLAETLGRVPLIRYGTTETGLNVSNPIDDPRGDTVGVPLPGVLARVWAADGEAGRGGDGEIQLRGPQVLSGYWHDPAATRAAFTPDGWFRTGDIGAVDPVSGHLRIKGRTKEMIITGGMNVYPREVEIVLEEHPSVAEAAVAGLPHERWGEQVTAWVVIRDGQEFDDAALIAYTRARLAAYKCPKQVFQRAALPRNHVGKIVRGELRLKRRRPDGLDLRGLGDQALLEVVQAGLSSHRGPAAMQRHRHRVHRSAADWPEQLAGRGDGGRRGSFGQAEEGHQRSRRVCERHQHSAVHDAARGAQVRRPGQPRDHPVGAGLVQDQAQLPGERHERDQGVQVSSHAAELSRAPEDGSVSHAVADVVGDKPGEAQVAPRAEGGRMVAQRPVDLPQDHVCQLGGCRPWPGQVD